MHVLWLWLLHTPLRTSSNTYQKKYATNTLEKRDTNSIREGKIREKYEKEKEKQKEIKNKKIRTYISLEYYNILCTYRSPCEIRKENEKDSYVRERYS